MSCLLLAIEEWVSAYVAVSGLLAAGLSCGTLVLSVAVMAIVITAPIGALGIDSTYKHLLEKE